MMKARTLELLQHPENLSAEDRPLLQEEIERFPYMQSLRTLQLSAVSRFDAENYAQELTKTAAYTTDKKILYQFINKKEQQEKETVAETAATAEETVEPIAVSENSSPTSFEEPQHTAEPVFATREEDLNFTKETVLDQFEQRTKEEIPASEISFNAFDSFLPDVKFQVPQSAVVMPAEQKAPAEEKITAEEEAPLPAKVYEPEAAQETVPAEIPKAETPVEKTAVSVAAASLPETTAETEEATAWKPMNFVSNPLDAQIQLPKTEPAAPAPAAVLPTELSHKVPVAVAEKKEEPVAQPKAQVSEEPAQNSIKEEEKATAGEEPREENSNIPGFVNTWQAWLKIDRTETVPAAAPVKILEKNTAIIDRFIEENPKISQLKEDSQYVVKEKNDDIWHLMTETLAKLYLEQRLYSKAIKAYEVLQQKYPARKQEFQERILEIKELRSGK